MISTARIFGTKLQNVKLGDDPTLYVQNFNTDRFPAIAVQTAINAFKNPAAIKFSSEPPPPKFEFREPTNADWTYITTVLPYAGDLKKLYEWFQSMLNCKSLNEIWQTADDEIDAWVEVKDRGSWNGGWYCSLMEEYWIELDKIKNLSIDDDFESLLGGFIVLLFGMFDCDLFM